MPSKHKNKGKKTKRQPLQVDVRYSSLIPNPVGEWVGKHTETGNEESTTYPEDTKAHDLELRCHGKADAPSNSQPDNVHKSTAGLVTRKLREASTQFWGNLKLTAKGNATELKDDSQRTFPTLAKLGSSGVEETTKVPEAYQSEDGCDTPSETHSKICTDSGRSFETAYSSQPLSRQVSNEPAQNLSTSPACDRTLSWLSIDPSCIKVEELLENSNNDFQAETLPSTQPPPPKTPYFTSGEPQQSEESREETQPTQQHSITQLSSSDELEINLNQDIPTNSVVHIQPSINARRCSSVEHFSSAQQAQAHASNLDQSIHKGHNRPVSEQTLNDNRFPHHGRHIHGSYDSGLIGSVTDSVIARRCQTEDARLLEMCRIKSQKNSAPVVRQTVQEPAEDDSRNMLNPHTPLAYPVQGLSQLQLNNGQQPHLQTYNAYGWSLAEQEHMERCFKYATGAEVRPQSGPTAGARTPPPLGLGYYHPPMQHGQFLFTPKPGYNGQQMHYRNRPQQPNTYPNAGNRWLQVQHQVYQHQASQYVNGNSRYQDPHDHFPRPFPQLGGLLQPSNPQPIFAPSQQWSWPSRAPPSDSLSREEQTRRHYYRTGELIPAGPLQSNLMEPSRMQDPPSIARAPNPHDFPPGGGAVGLEMPLSSWNRP